MFQDDFIHFAESLANTASRTFHNLIILLWLRIYREMMDKNHDNESGAIEILKQDLFKLDNEYRYVCVCQS